MFFTVCTHRRKPVLSDAQCHEILKTVWTESSLRDGWWVGHYVLMPDHVHFFARPEVGARLTAKWVQMWKGVTSRRIAGARNLIPPIWQAEYFDRYLRSAESYSQKWDYVEQNPVRAGLVQGLEDWPYRGVINDLMF